MGEERKGVEEGEQKEVEREVVEERGREGSNTKGEGE